MSILKTNQITDLGGNNIISSNGSGTFTQTFASSTPAFRAYAGSVQTPSANTDTKAQLDTESYDTDNCYDTSNYRFTPNVAGKYCFTWVAQDNYTSSSASDIDIAIRKNGSDIAESRSLNRSSNYYQTHTCITVVDMNGSSDYVEFFLKHEGGGGFQWRSGDKMQYAEGFKLA